MPGPGRRPPGSGALARQRAEIEAAFRDGWTPLPGQPGDPLPHDPHLGPNPNPEVIIIGTGLGQRVAVLFPHQDFPEIQFGHRFEQEPPAETMRRLFG